MGVEFEGNQNRMHVRWMITYVKLWMGC